MIRQSLEERRRTIGRSIDTLVRKTGALSPLELKSIRRLVDEMEELEGDIRAKGIRTYEQAFRNWLRHGLEPKTNTKGTSRPGICEEERALLVKEKRDMGTAGQGAYPGATAGFLAPIGFVDKVIAATKYAGPMLDVSTVTDTAMGGSPRSYPTDDDRAISGEIVPEITQTSTADVPMNQTVLGSFKFSSKMIKCSLELAEDAGFDFEAYVALKLGIRLGRIMNTKFTLGGGTTEPFGIASQASLGATAIGSAGNDGTAASTNTIGTSDLANLEKSVDPFYRVGARWMVHPNTLASLRQQLDKECRPLFAGLHQGGEDRLFNYPLSVNPNMDQLQSGPSSPPVTRKTVLFGDFSQYQIRRAPLTLQSLDEKFIDFGVIAFIGWWRSDGSLIDGLGGAVKYLANVY